MRVNGDLLLAVDNLRAMIQQRLAVSFLLHFRGAVERRLQRAEALDDFDRPLVADAGRAGNVIDGIAAQRHHIDHLLGTHAQNLFHLGGVADQIVFRWIEHANVVAHQLQHVLIAGDDENRMRLRRCLPREGADHVIGFKAGIFQHGNAVGLNGAANVGQLLRQIGRHLRAVRLVAAVFFFPEGLRLDVEFADGGHGSAMGIAKGWRRHVEDCRQILRRKIGPQLAQHVHKNVGRRRGDAGARGHGPLPRHGVIGAKDERHGVDEINRRFGRIARHKTYKKSVASCGYLRCRDAA